MSETAAENSVLQLNRVIDAPRERVFTAWTTPDAIKVWFGPEDCRVLEAPVDLRVGGKFCFSLSTQRWVKSAHKVLRSPTAEQTQENQEHKKYGTLRNKTWPIQLE